MKEFYQAWTNEEINEYIEQFNVLILFVVSLGSKEAQLEIHGDLNETQREQLLVLITTMFGGATLSSALCGKINEFAEKWYNKFVLKKKARVINCKKEKR